MRWITAIGLVLLLAASGLNPAWAEAPSGAGSWQIAELVWQGVAGRDRTVLEQVAGLHQGGEITRLSLAEAVRKLAASKDVRTVDAAVQELPSGQVRVILTLVQDVRLARLVVLGARKLGSDKIARAARLVPGDVVDHNAITEATERVRETYLRAGYLSARVTMGVMEDPTIGGGRASVLVQVREGKRGRIQALAIPGYPELDVDGQPLGVSVKSRVGRIFNESRLQADMARMATHLRERGYLHPQVGPERLIVDGGAVQVVIPVRVGQRVRITITGNHGFSDKEIRQVLDLPRQRTLDAQGLEQAGRRVRSMLYGQGYRDAEVTVRRGRHKSGDVKVQVLITQGRRHRIVETHISPVAGVSMRTLKKQVKGPWRPFAEPARDAAIARRVDRLETYLRSLGYLDAKVAYRLTARPNKPSRRILDYQITPGRLWRLTQVRTTGLGPVPVEARRSAQQAVQALHGRPFLRAQLRLVRSHIRSTLAEWGYADARVTIEEQRLAPAPGPAPDQGEGPDRARSEVHIDATFVVQPGPQVRIGEIALAGTFRTNPQVVRREVVFATGDLYRPSRIAQTRRRLFGAAAFDVVRIGLSDPNDHGPVRDVTIDVTEGKPGAIELGVGYGEEDRFRGLIDLSYRDLFRRGHRLGLRLRTGQLRRSATFDYGVPWLAGFKLNSHARLLFERANLVSFDRETRAAEVGVRPKLTEQISLALIYRFENNRFRRLPEDQVALVVGRRRVNVGSIQGSITRDSRDDPFSPSRGSVLGLAYEQGARLLGSQVQFGKITGQAARFTRLGPHAVLATKLQGGNVRRIFQTSEVPVSERFFLGGASTLRGYGLDSIGVAGETLLSGVAQGGEVMVLANLELRLWGTEGLGMVVFADAGNVWAHTNSVGLSDFRIGIGPGIHYATPVGPLRIDLGYKIDRRPGEGVYRIHFTLGHTF